MFLVICDTLGSYIKCKLCKQLVVQRRGCIACSTQGMLGVQIGYTAHTVLTTCTSSLVLQFCLRQACGDNVRSYLSGGLNSSRVTLLVAIPSIKDLLASEGK